MLFYFAAYNKLTFCSTTTTTTKVRGNYAFLRQNKYVGVQLILDTIFAHLLWPHRDTVAIQKNNSLPTFMKSVFSTWKYHGNLNSGLYGYLYDDLDHENKAIKIGFLK